MSQRWQEQSQEVSRSIAQWRQTHPKATLADIEAAVDAQMNQLRARMIEDVALASPVEQRETKPQRITCPQCGHHLQSRGKRARSLQTQGGQRRAAHAHLSELSIVWVQLFSPSIVCAVQDGAAWLQGFADGHRHDAVRILDFAHAAEYVEQVAEQGRLAGYHVPLRWLPVILHQLKHHGPGRIMIHLNWWHKHRPLPAVTDALRYFSKRLAQMEYPQFQAQGWPIGFGDSYRYRHRLQQDDPVQV